MSNSSNNPPDDFSETVPNIKVPAEDIGPVDWDKTNYNMPKQPIGGEEWGRTVANIKPIDTTPRSVPEADWGATRPDIRVPDTDFGGDEGYGKTTPYFQLPEAERQKYQVLPPTAAEQAAKAEEERKAQGGIPLWVWVSAGLFGMFLFALLVLLIVYFFFIGTDSYSVTVKSVPPGSDVLVDDNPWGLSREDGSIELIPLKAGRRVIKVVHPTYDCEIQTVELRGGENPPPLIARCKAQAVKPGEDCGTFSPGEFDKAERCYNQALDSLPDPFTDEALVRALNILIINFDTNKYDVPPQRLAALQKGAEFIRKLQDRDPAIVLEVGGHTDSVGNAAANQTLSDNRAKAVKDVLVRYGVKAEGLLTRGYGATQPKFDNSTEQGKFLNRRIQYSVVRK